MVAAGELKTCISLLKSAVSPRPYISSRLPSASSGIRCAGFCGILKNGHPNFEWPVDVEVLEDVVLGEVRRISGISLILGEGA